MAFRASASVWSKASRLPLTSKQANKDFYKGPGALPGLGPRAQGRHPRSRAPYLKMVEKMRYFVAPQDWLDQDGQLSGLYANPLRPYVFKSSNRSEVPTDWPKAATGKPEQDYNSKRGGIYGPQGFDGHYYLQLARLKNPNA